MTTRFGILPWCSGAALRFPSRDLCDQELASLRDDERRAKCDEMENDDHTLIPWTHLRITLDTEAEELDLFEVRLR